MLKRHTLQTDAKGTQMLKKTWNGQRRLRISRDLILK